VLRDAVTAGSLDKSGSVAQVLHFRIRTALHGQLTPRVVSYRDLLPHDPARHQPGGPRAAR